MTTVALVTGASGGIGRAIAQRLAEAGHLVLGGDLTPPDPLAPADERILHQELDVGDDDAVRAAVHRACGLGALRVVVNCAGILAPSKTADLPEDKLQAQLDVNLAGTVRVCRAAAPHLEPGSAIVNISSISSVLGGAPGVAVYAATKAGVEGFTRALACELGRRGVRVNAVAPGFVDAPMASLLRADPEQEARLVASVPLRRLARPEEIAEVVEFLGSDRASYINGETIRVDGGRVAC